MVDTSKIPEWRLLRRSGIAVVNVAACCGWDVDVIYQVGIGLNRQEVDVLKAVWPDATWYGCEPHPRIVRDLEDYPGRVYPVAVADFNGNATLYNPSRHKDGSSLHRPRGRTVGQWEVPVRTLDDLFPNPLKDKRVLLWLDCEGMELAVLKGAESFIDQVSVVNIEMTHNPPGDGWCDPVDVDDWLIDHGFYAQWVHTQRISGGQTDVVYVRGDLFNPSYCCIPGEVRRWRTDQLYI